MDSKLPGIAALPTLSQNANPKENKTCELYNDLTASIEVNEGNSEYLVYPFQSLKLNGQQMTIRLQEAPQISFSYDSLVSGRLVVSALSDFGPKALEHLEVEDRELLVEKQRRQKRRQKMRKHFKMERLGLVVVLCCFLWPCLMVTCTVIQPEKQLDAFLLSLAMLLLFGCVSCWTTIASIAVNEAVRAEAEQVRGRLKFMALRRVIGTHGCLFLAIACVIVMIVLLCLNDFVLVAVILAISASCCCFPAAWSFLKPQDDIDPEEVKNLCAEVCKNTIVFEGSILPGQPCICSWPGKYESAWEVLVYSSRKHRLSAAVVFLPEGSKHFGCHDAIPPEEELEGECWCVPLYGAKQVWGCRWWSLWMANIEKAVAQNVELEVYFFQKKKGQGKVPFEMVGQEHQKREAIYSKKKDFEESLMFQNAVAAGLHGLSEEKLGDSSSRYSREWRRLFLAWLPEAERQILEEAEGLGNSQKAEVAWLEKKKYKYTEVEVDVSKWNMPDEEVTPSSDSSQNP